jgi:hypothetical protein
MPISKSYSSYINDEKSYTDAIESYNYICKFCHNKLLKEWRESDILNPSEEFKCMVLRTKQKFNEARLDLEKAEKAYKRWFT